MPLARVHDFTITSAGTLLGLSASHSNVRPESRPRNRRLGARSRLPRSAPETVALPLAGARRAPLLLARPRRLTAAHRMAVPAPLPFAVGSKPAGPAPSAMPSEVRSPRHQGACRHPHPKMAGQGLAHSVIANTPGLRRYAEARIGSLLPHADDRCVMDLTT
jgi:hypothetical protein